ncbi:hypothetical protein RI367_001680 [Sorochytrium milnesiophthora]
MTLGVNGRQLAATVAVIVLWYVLSTCLSLYNKWLFGIKSFHYPLFTTSIHMLLQFCLSSLALRSCFKQYAPRRLSWTEVLFKVAPCALASGLDIGLSNSSLKTISLSFYTMVKSSVPFWVLVFAFVFGLERPTLRLGMIMTVISVGVFLTVWREAAFDFTGFIEILLASIMGGLRMSLTQILLSNSSLTLDNPLATNLYITPIMFGTLLPSSMAVESLASIGSTPFFATSSAAANTVALLLGGAVLAFSMITVEFQCISMTSGLTISVAAIFKEVITIVVSVLIFGDVLTAINVVGLAISLCGIAMYNYWKWQKVQVAMASSYRMNPLREDEPEIWHDDTLYHAVDVADKALLDGDDIDEDDDLHPHSRFETGQSHRRHSRRSSGIFGRRSGESIHKTAPATPGSPHLQASSPARPKSR